jgi:hypothetical protein
MAARMEAELDRDTERMARHLQGGDLSVGAALIPEAELPRFLQDVWVTKPDQLQKLKDAMMPDDFLRLALDHLTTLSPVVKDDFMTMLEGGIPYEEAMTLAEQIHQAERLYRNPDIAIPPVPAPPLLPLEEAPRPGGFLAPTSAPTAGPLPPVPPAMPMPMPPQAMVPGMAAPPPMPMPQIAPPQPVPPGPPPPMPAPPLPPGGM